MAQRHDDAERITVHPDGDRCIHSEPLVLGAPSVFDQDPARA
jgi:uncharacterized Fe-S cluster protein YjdI